MPWNCFRGVGFLAIISGLMVVPQNQVHAQSAAEWTMFGLGVADLIINGGQNVQTGRSSSAQSQQPGQYRVVTREVIGPDGRPRNYSTLVQDSAGRTSQQIDPRANSLYQPPGQRYQQRGWQSGPSQNARVPYPYYQYQTPSVPYQQQPRVQYQPRYTTPSVSYSSQPVRSTIVYSGLPITIRCPHGESGVCSYSLISSSNVYDYTIQGGEAQHLKETQSWQIRYNQGNGGGTKTYRLRGGRTYLLEKANDGRWQLYLDS